MKVFSYFYDFAAVWLSMVVIYKSMQDFALQIGMKTVTVVGLFLLLSAPVDAQSQVCPPGCECPNRPDADKYRVDCSSVDADSLASLNIPSFTTQL